MPNKMLIDATHPEETRVVVLRGNRVEEFDFESANRKQLRGKLSGQGDARRAVAAGRFVDYGGNRHASSLSEIHPDYYQIPVADRQALTAEEERAQRAADAEADTVPTPHGRGSAATVNEAVSEPLEAEGSLAAGGGMVGWRRRPAEPARRMRPSLAAEPSSEKPPTAMAAEPPIELAQLE
jgi:ribonuclease E